MSLMSRTLLAGNTRAVDARHRVVAGVAVGGWVKLVGSPVLVFCGNLLG